MQHDEVIWQVVNQTFCSFKVKTLTQNFCKNKHNVTGLCNRQSCPLANSRYATILEEKGVCYLYIKTIERAHSPKNMWEKIKLNRNYKKALDQISKQLEFFPKYQIHKNKQRLTKIHQYLIRMRKLSLKVRTKVVGINKKVERRERTREKKALKAAKIEDAISQELIARLKSGTYEGVYNYPQLEYEKVIDAIEEEEEEKAMGEEADEEEEEEDEDSDNVEYVEGYFESDDEIEEAGDFEMEDVASSSSSSGKKQVNIEYEQETEAMEMN